LLNHLVRRFETEIAPEEIIRRAERACERATATKFQVHAFALFEVWIKVKGWQRETIKILYYWSIPVSNDNTCDPQ